VDNLTNKYLHEGCVTERLKLRPLSINDTNDMFEYTSDPITCKFLKWGPHKEINETQLFINRATCDYKNPKDILWGIEHDDTLIGVIRIYNIDMTNKECEISYILNRKFEGKGYMTETVRKVIMFCFEELNLLRVKAIFDFENTSSLKVMERCNMLQIDNSSKVIIIKNENRLFKTCAIEKEV